MLKEFLDNHKATTHSESGALYDQQFRAIRYTEAIEAQNRELVEALEKIVKDGDPIRYETGAVARLGLQIAVRTAREALRKVRGDA